jgi:hypothetical protein
MKRCETCIHWHKKAAGARGGDAVGECRAGTPSRDFTWPRTRAGDHCSQYASAATMDPPPSLFDAGTPGERPSDAVASSAPESRRARATRRATG